MHQELLETLDKGVLTVTMNRPERFNAMTEDHQEAARGGERVLVIKLHRWSHRVARAGRLRDLQGSRHADRT